MLTKARLLVMGLLAVMAIGMVASTAAVARPGPFWWVREGGKGEGKKLAENITEQGSGSSSEITFSTTIGGTPIGWEAQLKAKFDIWNTKQQGQIKAQLKFDNVHIIGLPNCQLVVLVPEDLSGHLMWKYRGNKKELEQGPEGGQEKEQGQEWDVAIAPPATVLGAHGFETQEGKHPIAKVSIGKTNCGVFENMKLELEGVTGFQDQQLKLGEFAKKTSFTLPGHEIWQHYWPGNSGETEAEPAKGELKEGAIAAFLNGRLPLEFQKQEVDVREQ